ncbi:MAG: hypothetical protein CSA82_01555 [Actinobacteria bacterium]|nr:MAG: hypothetical protein CSA82_01555 [Actinomycetota bacterium]
MTLIHPRLAKIFASLALVPLALSISACSGSFGGQDKADTNDSSSTQPTPSSSDTIDKDANNKKGDSDSTSTSTADNSQILGTWEGAIYRRSYKIDINSLIVQNGETTLTFTLTNTGPENVSFFDINDTDFGSITRGMLESSTYLIDVDNHLIYDPRTTDDGDCLCTTIDDSETLEPDESVTLFTTFTELPESTTSVTVSFAHVPMPIENIPVMRK